MTDLLGKRFERRGRGPDGFDCYGLAMEVSRRFGVELPPLTSPNVDPGREPRSVHDAVVAGALLFRRIPAPQPGCLVAFRLVPKYISHVGVMLDVSRFIHVMAKSQVTIEQLASPLWERKIAGYYLYESR